MNESIFIDKVIEKYFEGYKFEEAMVLASSEMEDIKCVKIHGPKIRNNF